MNSEEFKEEFLRLIDNSNNPYHPLVFINGAPKFGENIYIGLFSEINAKGSEVIIGDNCDIASFVSLNVADSHRKCIGLEKGVKRKPIKIDENVFIGSHSFIPGGTRIGHHSVVAAGTIAQPTEIPPWSLVVGNPMVVKPYYFRDE